MIKLICSNCDRLTKVSKFYGDEKCKECGALMKFVEVVESKKQKPIKKKEEKVVEEKPEEEIEEEEKPTTGFNLPTTTNFCGELPDFSDNSVI